jgi:hypothetical protein
MTGLAILLYAVLSVIPGVLVRIAIASLTHNLLAAGCLAAVMALCFFAFAGKGYTITIKR